jgi:signal transduction histidine kinase
MTSRPLFCLIATLSFARGAHGGTEYETEIFNRQVKVELTPEERDWLAAHPLVRWGADPDAPPFSSFGRDGKLEGIDTDITLLVAHRVGLNLSFVRAVTREELLEKAKAGEIDILSTITETPEPLESFSLTDTFSDFPIVFVTRQDSPFFTSPLDIGSMALAQAREYPATVHLEQHFPAIRLHYTDTPEEALKLVARGKADATIMNLATATRVVRLNGLTNLKISGVTHFSFPLRLAVRKDAPELLSILNKGLATITPREQELIHAAHLTPDIGKARNWGIWRRRALSALLIGAPLVAALILWNRSLSYQMRQRKAAEGALREARDRLAQDARDLQAANEDLEAFTSSASHDLRAPLRRLSAFASLIVSETENRLTQESKTWLTAITDEAQRMDRLIHDLLAFAGLGRAGLHKQCVDITKLVKDTIEEFRPQWESRQVLWTVGDLGQAFGDPRLLRLVLANLIDNALKYTKKRSEARITIDICPAKDASAQNENAFFIRDNGCGFDPNRAGALFMPFQRLHPTREYEGTGIGLANVKRIIQKHEGRVWFESQLDQGATFFVALPTKAALEKKRLTPAAPASDFRPAPNNR